jgi:hypothetical protein
MVGVLILEFGFFLIVFFVGGVKDLVVCPFFFWIKFFIGNIAFWAGDL